jgi:hypothetical protein
LQIAHKMDIPYYLMASICTIVVPVTNM